jgi:glycerol-3-phosphate O-acyltransferase
MTPEETIRRGEAAARLLNDKMLTEALDMIERDIIVLWEAAPERDKEGKEELWKLYKTSKKFRGVLEGAVVSGKVEIARQKTLAQKSVEFTRKYVGV